MSAHRWDRCHPLIGQKAPMIRRHVAWPTEAHSCEKAGPFDLVKRWWADPVILTGLTFSPKWASVGSCHVSTYHRRLPSNEWMASVRTLSRHVFPPANENFTRGKFTLVRAVNGLSDPKPDPIT